MGQDFTVRKRAILIMLGLLLGADIGLGIYSYRLAAAPHTPQKEFDDENLRLQVLDADIRAAQKIKEDMPTTKKDCEKFEKSLPLESVGSSSMTADLDDVARQSGLQIITLAAKQKDLSARGLTEVEIDLTVNGDYSGVARFVNGLQRSAKFYIVDGLALSTESQGQNVNGPLRVAMHLRTYFREAA
jgi:Tfp pilus assembly protein PilO